MTRDEAIACLIDWAGEWITQHSFSLMPARAAAERAEYEEAKAALAVPMMIDHAIPGDDKTVMVSLNRCQHQAADASLDCTEPAVLCETHGGHDGCVAAIDGLNYALSEAYSKGYNAAEINTRDEIARALMSKQAAAHVALRGLKGLADLIANGSISEWLPKEGD